MQFRRKALASPAWIERVSREDSKVCVRLTRNPIKNAAEYRQYYTWIACKRLNLIEHEHYIDKYGEDPPEILNWKWSNSK